MKQQLAQLIKVTAATADRVRKPGAGVVFLIYHRVGGRSGLQIDLPTPLFEDQMAWLIENATVVTIDEAEAMLLDQRPAPAGATVVTFDDGTADFVDEALPVLARHGIPATLYVATDFVERQRLFPSDGRPASWGGLGECLSTGLVEIGSHTHRHALLDRLAAQELHDELDRSIELVGSRLGVTARHFAYPKALLGSPAAEHAVRRRFETAALAGTRPNIAGATDLHRLSRTPIQVSDGLQWFQHKAAGGMALEDTLRRVANRRRYQGATT